MKTDDDCPFGDDAIRTRRTTEPCSKCGSANTSVDYGQVDDDKNLPEPVKAGKLPIACGDCGHMFYGGWAQEVTSPAQSGRGT